MIPADLKGQARIDYCVQALMVNTCIEPLPVPPNHTLFECVNWENDTTCFRHIPNDELVDWHLAMNLPALDHINFQNRGAMLRASANTESKPMSDQPAGENLLPVDPEALKAAQQAFIDNLGEKPLTDEQLRGRAMTDLIAELNRVIGFECIFSELDVLTNATEFLRRYAPDSHGQPQIHRDPYIVVERSSLNDLQKDVCRLVAKGYGAQGGITVVATQDDPMSMEQPHGPRFVQAMVLA